MEEGLRRIFAGLDYSLEFDGQGKPCGIVIVGEKESARGRAKGTTARRSDPEPVPDNPDGGSAEGEKGTRKKPVSNESADAGPGGVGPEGEKLSIGTKSPSPPTESADRGDKELERPELPSPGGP